MIWTPILYTSDGGYYEVSYAKTAGGPYTVHGVTANKSAAGYLADGLAPGTLYYFIVRAFTPAHGDQQNDLWSAFSDGATASTPAGIYLLRVNCGGDVYGDTKGNTWAADRPFGTGPWGAMGGSPVTTANAIDNTTDDTLYQSERQWSGSATPGYRFTVPNGTYQVTFKFAETAYAAAGKRVFNIKLEGATALTNYDIFAAAGGRNIVAPDRTFTVKVTDGELTVDFIQVVGAPKVNAIRLKLTGDSVRPGRYSRRRLPTLSGEPAFLLLRKVRSQRTKVPARRSRSACWISSCVVITKGP